MHPALQKITYKASHVAAAIGNAGTIGKVPIYRMKPFIPAIKANIEFTNIIDDIIDQHTDQTLLLTLDASFGVKSCEMLSYLIEEFEKRSEKTFETYAAACGLRYSELIAFGNALCQGIKQELELKQEYLNTPTAEGRRLMAEAHIDTTALYIGMIAHVIPPQANLLTPDFSIDTKRMHEIYPFAEPLARAYQYIDDIADVINDVKEEANTGVPTSNILIALLEESGQLEEAIRVVRNADGSHPPKALPGFIRQHAESLHRSALDIFANYPPTQRASHTFAAYAYMNLLPMDKAPLKTPQR